MGEADLMVLFGPPHLGLFNSSIRVSNVAIKDIGFSLTQLPIFETARHQRQREKRCRR